MILLYKGVPRLASVHHERFFTFKQRRSYEANEYQSGQQTQHQKNRLERNENHHNNLRD